jgi:arylformamidase
VPAALVDLSHTVEDGMTTYRGLPAPVVCDYWSREDSRAHYDEGTEFHIGRIDMVSNTGTYLDSPFHRFRDGKDLSQLPLDPLAGRDAVTIDGVGGIGPKSIAGRDLRGRAVLFRTGWDRHWRSEQYFEDHPYLEAATAEALVQAGAAIVGIDSVNIDDTRGGSRPVHTTLLRAEIPIVEHLSGLGAVPEHGARFYAVPVRVKGMGTFPVRAFAELPGEDG